MYPKLLHIYGPFFLQSYGVCIVLGIVLFSWLLYRDPVRRLLVNDDLFHWFLSIGIITALLGGRLLFGLIQGFGSVYEFFELWHGGFAILGSILGVLLVLPWFFIKNNIPVLPVLDRISLYAPVLQSVSRLGCFFAGCCFGKPAGVMWALKYSNSDCSAPLGIALHPTQLYSAFILLCIFGVLYRLQNYTKSDGQLMGFYLLFTSLERFVVDFFRGDQIFLKQISFVSGYQFVSLIIMLSSLVFLLYSYYLQKTAKAL